LRYPLASKAMRRLLLFSAALTILLLQAFSGRRIIAAETPALTSHQRIVISYFKEIALGFEFGTAARITRKWTIPIRIFMEGSADTIHHCELETIVDELNELITDGVYLEIVSERSAANMHIVVGHSSAYTAFYPFDAHLARSNSGMYHIYWNKNNAITKAHIFVNTHGTSIEEQRHVLREEVTQSLGLGRDSDMLPESIFRSSFNTITRYTPIDRDVIRLLYHPGIPAGLSSTEVDAMLTSILLSENHLRVSSAQVLR
jgi:hypothetical protein